MKKKAGNKMADKKHVVFTINFYQLFQHFLLLRLRCYPLNIKPGVACVVYMFTNGSTHIFMKPKLNICCTVYIVYWGIQRINYIGQLSCPMRTGLQGNVPLSKGNLKSANVSPLNKATSLIF